MDTKFQCILYRLFFILICGYGICLSVFDTSMESFMGNNTSIFFYTIQSNILVLILEIFLLLFLIIEVVSKKKVIGEKTVAAKYVVTVAITITFLVYWTMLAPYMGAEYIFTASNILVHTLSPILMMADFFLFDREIKLKKKSIFLVIIPPLCYLIFAIIRANVSDILLTGGSRFPYWFIDLDVYGWLGNENGVGVLYWVGLIVIMVLFLRNNIL